MLRCAHSSFQAHDLRRIPLALSVGIWLLLTTSTFAKSPNIIFILADDLGYSDLGCYGGEIATPNLDRLAANGLRFTQFYNTARCWPTRSALLSGYYAQQIRRDALPEVPGGANGARPAWSKLLPQMLASAGYRSYHTGKWHVDGKVLAGGFLKSLDTRNQGNFFTGKGNFIDDQPAPQTSDESRYYATIAAADHAIECLAEHHRDHKDTPFFHYIAFIAPHFPLHALPEDIAKYKGKYDMGWDEMRTSRHERQREMGLTQTTLSHLEEQIGPPYHFPDSLAKLGPGEVNRPLKWSELNDEQRRFQATKMEIHAAMIDRMDVEIGRILNQLEQMNAIDDTLIFFASDNGASAEIMVRNGGHDPKAPPGSAASYLCLGPGFSSACNTPHRRHKTWVHEGGISTPLIAHWPNGISGRNELRTTPGHVIDFVPTALDIAGVDMQVARLDPDAPGFPGRSLRPSFASDVRIKRDYLWWLHEGNRAIRVDDWKLVAAKNEEWQLYNLKDDRAEERDLAATMPAKAKELAALWQSKVDEFTILSKKSMSSQPPEKKKKKEKGAAKAAK